MGLQLSVRDVETLPAETPVRDYDQLDARTQQYLAELDVPPSTTVEVPPGLASAFEDRALVNYTSYLQARRPDGEN